MRIANAAAGDLRVNHMAPRTGKVRQIKHSATQLT
jgi:hypothetical protein